MFDVSFEKIKKKTSFFLTYLITFLCIIFFNVLLQAVKNSQEKLMVAMKSCCVHGVEDVCSRVAEHRKKIIKQYLVERCCNRADNDAIDPSFVNGYHREDSIGCYYSYTFMHYAAELNNIEVLQQLLNDGADVNIVSSSLSRYYPINRYLRQRELLRFSESRLTYAPKKRTPLSHAIIFGCDEAALWLIEHGARLNPCELNEEAPLTTAILVGNNRMARYLIQHGAHINPDYTNEKKQDRDFNDIYPHSTGELDIKTYLDRRYSPVYEHAPLHAAVESENWEMIRYLIEEGGVNINILDTTNKTPLDIAVRYFNHTDVVDYLRQHLVPDVPANDALYVAHYLVRHGACVDTPTNDALFWAVKNDNIDLAAFLIEHGARVNNPVEQPYISELYDPFVQAFEDLNRSMIRLFLKHGASYDNAVRKRSIACIINKIHEELSNVRILASRREYLRAFLHFFSKEA